MEYRAWFRCISEECGKTYELEEVVYRCKSCGNLLEVTHDLDALRQISPIHWARLFGERYKTADWPYGSSIWGKKEWVLPQIDNDNIVSMYEGSTNLFWTERFGKVIGINDLWVKQCGNSHTGSFKDLGMTVLVSQVKQMMSRGAPIKAVACASTGDTSAALAAYAATAGIPAVVFLPRNKVSLAQLIQPVSNGAHVLALDTDFDGCMELVRQLTEDNTIYLANSMNSLRIEGQKTISIEIVQQFDWEVPDTIIIPGGNLGNVSALGKGFDMMFDLGVITRRPRIIVAQAAKANPLYQAYKSGWERFDPVQAEKTLASAIQIGNPVSLEKAVRTLKKFNGIVEQATEDELANAAALADRCGMFNCPHTGVALAVLLKLKEEDTIGSDERVVVISTAHGLKFSEFKVGYHEGTLDGVDSRHSNPPIELPPDIDRILEAIDARTQKQG
ncbi:MAG: threonine synthase [Planctomycetota bacterium]|nr:threonine synthase [Planctomycetota bacterium]